jgi:CRISPR-associated protein Csm5
MSAPMKFRAVPLTPIHIGDGTELLPDHYRIKPHAGEPSLELFEPAEVLAAMPPGDQEKFIRLLGDGSLPRTQELLQRSVRPEHVLARIPVSQESANELQKALTEIRRSGAVQPFIRSGRQPFIPGSSIKGALRTALLSALAAKHAVKLTGEMRDKHRTLVREAFRMRRNDTADDPFRFVHVADVPIPKERTRIDQVRIIKKGASTKGIQMHYERLLAIADGRSWEEVQLDAVIEVDEEGLRACRARRPDAAPQIDISWNELRQAVNRFHWAIWEEERRHFSEFFQTNPMLDRIEKSWLVRTKISSPDARVMLLRLGRFGHFESKSVEGLRQGHVPQRRGSKYRHPNEWGDTRTVIPLVDKQGLEAMVPFGWLLLVPNSSGAAA